MFFKLLITLFNNFTLNLFRFIYKWFKVETIEDKFHKLNKDKKLMNKVKLDFNKEDDYKIVKNNLLKLIHNIDFLKKYDINTVSILNNTNNKFAISFKDKFIIYIYFNHYYFSGANMFILLNQIVNTIPPNFLQTNPFFGIINLPFYIYELTLLNKIQFLKTEKQTEHVILDKKINAKNKRYYLYWNILNKVYKSLQMNRPMTVALSVAFDEVPYINNNVGILIIKYEITDTIESLEQKIKKASYQVYCSNFILNCPLPNIGNFELRNYVDCIISSLYIKSDLDFKIAWNCSKPAIEQMYVGSVSIIHSDNTMDINMCFNTCSANYKNSYVCIDNYFD